MNKYRVSNGMWAYCSSSTYNTPCWRIQVYWPEIRIRLTELHVMFRTSLRIIWTRDERGFGFQCLGFGCGIVWER